MSFNCSTPPQISCFIQFERMKLLIISILCRRHVQFKIYLLFPNNFCCFTFSSGKKRKALKLQLHLTSSIELAPELLLFLVLTLPLVLSLLKLFAKALPLVLLKLLAPPLALALFKFLTRDSPLVLLKNYWQSLLH